MSVFRSSSFLSRVLLVDAVATAITVIAMLAGARTLAPLLGLPAEFLTGVGLLLIPFCAFAGWLATREYAARAAVWLIICANLAWVLASMLLLASDRFNPTFLGQVYVIVQAIAVAVLAELQFLCVRRHAGVPA